MALLDDIRKSLRVTTDALDSEIEMNIGAALYDMERAGVNPALLTVDEETGNLENALVKKAVTVLCKADFGYDVNEADRFEASYDRILNALLNSSQNIAAMEREPEPEPEPQPDEQPDDGEEGGGE